MTPEAHNRNVGVAHLVYGGLNIVLIGCVATFMLGRGFWSKQDTIFMSVAVAFVTLMNLVFTLPSFVAGWALLKRKPWAKMAAIIASVVAAMYFPFGAAVTVYSLWFLFSAPGKKLYDKLPQSLPSAAVNLTDQIVTERAKDVPRMPDWR